MSMKSTEVCDPVRMCLAHPKCLGCASYQYHVQAGLSRALEMERLKDLAPVCKNPTAQPARTAIPTPFCLWKVLVTLTQGARQLPRGGRDGRWHGSPEVSILPEQVLEGGGFSQGERRGASNLRQREGEGGQHSVKEGVFPTRSWETTVVLRRRML